MPSVTSSDPQAWTRRWIASGLTTAVIGSSAPIPLYPIYRADLGLDAFTMTLIFVVYIVAVLGALLTLPRVLSRLRNPYRLMVPAMIAVILGAILMAFANHLSVLIAGRILSGIGTGSATLAANLLLVELSPGRNVQRAAMISTLAFSVGSSVGPILTGILLQFGLAPLVTPFVFIGLSALLSIHAAGKHWNAERQPHSVATPPSPDATPDSPIQAIPWRPLGLCGLTVFLSWGLGASMMALGPLVSHELLDGVSYAISGYVVAMFMLSAAISQWLHRRTALRLALLRGCSIVILGTAICWAGLMLGSPLTIILGLLILAVGHGSAFGGAGGLVQVLSPPRHRARTISLFYVSGYTGSLTPLLLGAMMDRTGAAYTVTAALGGLALGMALIVFAGLRMAPTLQTGAGQSSPADQSA